MTNLIRLLKENDRSSCSFSNRAGNGICRFKGLTSNSLIESAIELTQPKLFGSHSAKLERASTLERKLD
jgi:hypothetical protein